MKIGFVLDDTLDSNDGVSQYVQTVGKWLAQQGHDVHYLVGMTERRDIPNIHSLARNIKVKFNGNVLSVPLPTSRRRLRKLLEAEQFDVLHVQMPYSPMLAHQIIQAADQRTVIVGTFHVLPYSRLATAGNRLLGLWVYASLKRFDAIFANTTATQAFIKQSNGRDSTVLPMVIDEDRFKSARPLPEYDDDVLTIMFLGRLVPRKGCRTLLEATTILRQRNHLPAFRVVVCGGGPLDGELQQYVYAQGLDDVVSFTGFVPEETKPNYVASADIMTYPSSGGESFGIVLLEAMASGRPVVLAGDNPGYRSVLGDHPELLFTPNEPFVLANKLTAYLRDADERHRAVRWQKQYVQQFDIAVVGSKLEAEYARLLQKKR